MERIKVLRHLGRIIRKGRVIVEGRLGRVSLRLSGVKFGHGLRVYGMPVVSRIPGSTILIGDRVVLCSSSRFTALGIDHPIVIRTFAPSATISIGDDVGISGGSYCCATRVTIGAKCMFGANVTVTDTDFHPIAAHGRRYAPSKYARCAPVTIGENVFVGAGVIILKGVTIGDNSVIGAGSVVSSDIPPDVVAAGNPCRIIGPLPASQPEIAS